MFYLNILFKSLLMRESDYAQNYMKLSNVEINLQIGETDFFSTGA